MYTSYIGLEVHIHLLTKTKVFCACEAAFGDEPNTHICPVCLGHPGVLPSLNQEALRMGLLVARALDCTIPERTWFERKQYFYPDMPKNYQISQFASPLGSNGGMEISVGGRIKRIRIRECHLEEDAGKMIHAGNVTLLDYNRAGMALLEIVTEPDMETGEEAELFIQQLRRTVRYLEVCDGNMEEGSLRADANVSINLPGMGLGKKVEIKNLNSSRFVRLGLDYEIQRQTELLDGGKTVVQETRLWNENRDQTESMRTKENAHDYRFFPEPDLPVLELSADYLRGLETALVELPFARVQRLEGQYGLTASHADSLCEEKPLADYFEQAVAEAERKGLEKSEGAPKITAWITSDIKKIWNREGISASNLAEFQLTATRLAELVVLVVQGKISGKNAKQILELVVVEDRDPEAIMVQRGWEMITDTALLRSVVDRVCEQQITVLQSAQGAAKNGDTKRRASLEAYLVGQAVSQTQGKGEPTAIKRLIEQKVEEQ
jgi:aspartyl-tRNA(Asn)/glutamyl-tRNA(Gln) amidotransferase subunit B